MTLMRHTRRKEFLAGIGAACATLGAWTLRGTSTAAADTPDALACCTVVNCASCPTTVGKCPSPHKYCGYTWACCYGGRLVYCWDCDNSSCSYVCTCTKVTGDTC